MFFLMTFGVLVLLPFMLFMSLFNFDDTPSMWIVPPVVPRQRDQTPDTAPKPSVKPPQTMAAAQPKPAQSKPSQSQHRQPTKTFYSTMKDLSESSPRRTPPTKRFDPYETKEFDDAEDFDDEYKDEFDDFDDAEDYFNEYRDKKY